VVLCPSVVGGEWDKKQKQKQNKQPGGALGDAVVRLAKVP
jgi:hypothetical protein